MQEILQNNSNIIQQADELIQVNAETVTLSQNIATTSKQIVSEIHHLDETINQVSDAAAGIGEEIRKVSGHTVEQERLAELVQHHASNSGMSSVRQTIEGMLHIQANVETVSQVIQRLHGFSENIGSVFQVIEDIAEQTNLLALNASIVAAQAGEHGTGFAVVADEVRSLATNTKASVAEVGNLIGQLQQEAAVAVKSASISYETVKSGVDLSKKTEAALETIQGSTEDSLGMASQVKLSMNEQSSNIQQIVAAMDNIRKLTAEIRAAADHQHSGTQQTLTASAKNQDFTSNVKNSIDQQSEQSQKVADLIDLLAHKPAGVSAALLENKRTSEAILETIDLLSGRAQQNSSLASNLESISEQLDQQAQELATSIKRFSSEKPPGGTGHNQ